MFHGSVLHKNSKIYLQQIIFKVDNHVTYWDYFVLVFGQNRLENWS